MPKNHTPSLGEVTVPVADGESVDYQQAAISAMSAVSLVIQQELEKLPKAPHDDTAIVRNLFVYMLNQINYNLEVIKTN